MNHFEIVEAEPATGMQTCMCRSCIACGQCLTAGGGTGDYLCQTCLEAIRRKPWRGNLRKLRDASTEDLLTIIDLL